MSEHEEPRVVVLGPHDTYDTIDVATGVRFVQGRAENVSLSVAEKMAQRRGYEIEGTLHTYIK